MHKKSMTEYRLYQVDVFTKQLFSGNPAGVVTNADGLDDSQMQEIARELNNSETAFLLSPTASDHDVRVRFFTPTTEVPICGHATVAAHFVNAIEKKLPECQVRQKTGAGILPVDVVPQQNAYKIVMTQGDIEISPAIPIDVKKKIIGALHLSNNDLDARCPMQIASTGHSKVMVGIKRKIALDSLAPDMAKLQQISHEMECMGFFVFTFDSKDNEVLIHGRMFAPAIGITEDPVTGNANGPCGAYLVHNGIIKPQNDIAIYKARQGEAMGRPGLVDVIVECENDKPVRVKIAGEAVVVFNTILKI